MLHIYRKLILKYPGLTAQDFRLVDNGDGIKLDRWSFTAPRPDLAAVDLEIPDKTVTDELNKQQQAGAQEDIYKTAAAFMIKFVATLPSAPQALIDLAKQLP
ncbi:MAG: hypothetical protein HYX63_01635 [Gammaproteobacteria bacterium]|nr:hypothetical protein [Gammaproteobacteria bacterium]